LLKKRKKRNLKSNLRKKHLPSKKRDPEINYLWKKKEQEEKKRGRGARGRRQGVWYLIAEKRIQKSTNSLRFFF
jgi:hypothetical protein